MDKQNKMKSFRFKYSPLIWLLLCVIALIVGVGLGLNVYSAIELFEFAKNMAISSIILSVLCLAILVLVISVMWVAKYQITQDYFRIRFGFIVLKLEISKVCQIIHFKKSDKLVLYFDNGKYIVIIISPEFYNDFILSLREVNDKIVYDTEIDGEELPKN